MGKSMDRGKTGRANKPRLTLKEKLMKRKQKKQAKEQPPSLTSV